MQTDAKTKLFKYRNVSTNFMASHFIEVNEFESDEERNEFENQLADFQGADDALKMMLVERKATEESAIEIKKVDIQNVERLYEYTETSVRDSIIRNYLIPPVLLLQTAGKMGTSKEILDAVNYYNGVVDYEQYIIEESFTDLFKNSIIKNDGNFSIISLKAQVETTEVINLIANTNLTIDQKISSLTLLYGFTKEEAINLSGI